MSQSAPIPSFVWKSRIRYADTDVSGGIHYASIFRHLEAAEHEFLRSIGYPYAALESGPFRFPRVHAECDYFSPLGYDDEVAIEVCVHEVGRSSFTLAFSAMAGGRLSATARIKAVQIDRSSRKATALPEAFRRALESSRVAGEKREKVRAAGSVSRRKGRPQE